MLNLNLNLNVNLLIFNLRVLDKSALTSGRADHERHRTFYAAYGNDL